MTVTTTGGPGPARHLASRPDLFVPRAEISPQLLAAEADTLGWDVVHALRLPQVNAALAAGERWPTTFTQDLGEFRLSGTFGQWRLVRGGSNSILFVRAVLARATLTSPGRPDLDLTDGAVTVSVKLAYLPQPPQHDPASGRRDGPSPDDGGREYLAARTSSTDPDDPPAVVQTVDPGSADPTPLQCAVLRAALAGWFQSNLHLFTHVFCTLDLDMQSPRADFQWLRPTWTGYAYANGPTDETSFFGVLTLTSGDAPSRPVHQLTPAAVPPGCTTAVLVSQGAFLRHLMIPGLTRALPGTTVEDFTLDRGTVRATRQIALSPVDVDGTTYRPFLDRLELQVVGDEVQLRSVVSTQVSAGITAVVDETGWFRLDLIGRADGGQTLDFAPSRPPQRTDRTVKEPWVTLTEILVLTIGAIVALVAGILIPGTGAAIVAALLIGLVAGIAAATPTLIALVAGGAAASALPSISELLGACTVDIRWPDASGVVLRTVELNGSLQLGGTLKPKERR
jgi:hypothetical protein